MYRAWLHGAKTVPRTAGVLTPLRGPDGGASIAGLHRFGLGTEFGAPGRRSAYRANAPSSQRARVAESTAPEWRASSRPPRNRIKVGILRILNCPASSGCSSVLTLPTCRVAARCCAVRSRTGAMAVQGPHQGAQKSTSIGRLLLPVCVAKEAESRGMDFPSSSSDLQRGHFGCSATRADGVRTTV
jgi:hypothetical protein